MPIQRIPRWVAQSAIGVCLVVSLTAVFGASRLQSKPAQGAVTVAAQNGVCPSGYSGSPETGCVDVNECAAYNGGCDMLNRRQETPGSRTLGRRPGEVAGDVENRWFAPYPTPPRGRRRPSSHRLSGPLA